MWISTRVNKIKYWMNEWKQEFKTEIGPTHITTTRYHLNAWTTPTKKSESCSTIVAVDAPWLL